MLDFGRLQWITICNKRKIIYITKDATWNKKNKMWTFSLKTCLCSMILCKKKYTKVNLWSIITENIQTICRWTLKTTQAKVKAVMQNSHQTQKTDLLKKHTETELSRMKHNTSNIENMKHWESKYIEQQCQLNRKRNPTKKRD